MPPDSPRAAVDDELSEHGRALAKALLGDIDLRARRLPAGHPMAAAPRPNRSVASSESSAGRVAVLDAPPIDAPTPVATPPVVVPAPAAAPTARPATLAPPVPGVWVGRVSLPRLDDVDPDFGLDELRDDHGASRPAAAIVEWVIVVSVAFVVALLLKTYAIQTFEIPSESMEHTLEIGDRVLVNKLAYTIGGGVERGDVVVFDRPASARTGDPSEPDDLIKRVIGVPGDTVESRRGVIYVNGRPLPESEYLPADVRSFNFPAPVSVGTGQVFVMGDNRAHSYDSRFFGPIPTSTIVGRAICIAWPFSRVGGL